jgi:NAD(P)-dependent dehydrogenase (short-subunit alcohol dehydrogenase family)
VSSASILPCSPETAAACLSGDEVAARAAARSDPNTAYSSNKYALARWLRRISTHADWAGSGILLNGINPGIVKTPMTADFRASEEGRAMLAQSTPIAVEDYCEPEVIAEAACFLATLEGSYLVGQLLFVDGGTDVIMRPETV